MGSSTIVYDGLMVVHHRSNFAMVGHISSFWTKTLFTRIIDTSPMRTTKTPPTLSMLSSFASVFLFVSCNIRIRSGLYQMTQLLKKKRTNFNSDHLQTGSHDVNLHHTCRLLFVVSTIGFSAHAVSPPPGRGDRFQMMKLSRTKETVCHRKGNHCQKRWKSGLIPTQLLAHLDDLCIYHWFFVLIRFRISSTAMY